MPQRSTTRSGCCGSAFIRGQEHNVTGHVVHVHVGCGGVRGIGQGEHVFAVAQSLILHKAGNETKRHEKQY